MNGVLKLITLLAELTVYFIDKFRKSKTQATADRIDADPAAEFMRQFKRDK